MTEEDMIARANIARISGRTDQIAEKALREASRTLVCYGTLVPGRENGHILAPLGGVWSEVTVRGRLVKLGWGAAKGFPAIALDGDAEEIDAHAITSIGLTQVWDALDHFEGEDYIRLIHRYDSAQGGGLCNIYVHADHTGIPA